MIIHDVILLQIQKACNSTIKFHFTSKIITIMQEALLVRLVQDSLELLFLKILKGKFYNNLPPSSKQINACMFFVHMTSEIVLSTKSSDPSVSIQEEGSSEVM